MRPNPEKQDWINVALSIRQFHIDRLKANPRWKVEDTAKALRRSIGAVSQYLTIGSFLKTHENQIKKFETMKEAVEFCKNKKRDMFISE